MRLSFLAASALVAMTVPSLALADPPPVPGGSPPAAPAPAASPAPAPPPRKHGSRLPGALLMGMGAAGLGAGAVFGAIATASGASVRSQCTGNVCPPSVAPDIARTETFQNGSYAALAAGGAFAVVGLVLVLVAPGEPVPDEPTKSARLAPWVGPHGAGLGFTASF